MKTSFTKSLIGLSIISILKAIGSGARSTTYYRSYSCSILQPRLCCNNLNQLECCDVIPSGARLGLSAIKPLGDADIAVGLGFKVSERDEYNCGRCQTGEQSGTCYGNDSPFYYWAIFDIASLSCHRKHHGDRKAIPKRESKDMEEEIVTEGKCSQKVEITYGDKSYRTYGLDGKHHEDREEMMNDFLKMEANEFHAKWHKYWTRKISFKPPEHPTDNDPVQPMFFNEHAQ